MQRGWLLAPLSLPGSCSSDDSVSRGQDFNFFLWKIPTCRNNPARIAAGSATGSFWPSTSKSEHSIHSVAGKWRFCNEKLLGFGQTFCFLCLSLQQVQNILKCKTILFISAELLIVP